jgi:hypothetical protein
MEQPSALTDDNLPSPDQPVLDDLLRWSRQPKRFMSRGGFVDKDAENQVRLGRRHTQQDASSNANGRAQMSSKPTSQTHGEHRRTKSTVGTTGKLTRKNLGLGMGMQGTPPASVVMARNRSRSSSLTGLEGGGRGLIDFAVSTPTALQCYRCMLWCVLTDRPHSAATTGVNTHQRAAPPSFPQGIPQSTQVRRPQRP